MRGSIDMMRAYVAALCLLAGCDYIFRIDRIPLIDGTSVADKPCKATATFVYE